MLEVARQQRDEDIAIAKKVAENRVQRARDARKADELKRSIRANAAQLNQMVLRPQKGEVCAEGADRGGGRGGQAGEPGDPEQQGCEPADEAAGQHYGQHGQRGSPQRHDRGLEAEQGAGTDPDAGEDLTAAKNARLDKLHEQLAQAEALPDSEKARALQDRLKARIRDTENRVSLPMTVDQLRLLKSHYQQHAACDPHRKQDVEPCKG